MTRKMNWEKVRRRRGGSKQDLPILGDPEKSSEDDAEKPDFVPRNRRNAERDANGRLRSNTDWRDESRYLKGHPKHPDTTSD